MAQYYSLAETVVNGEIIIQGISVTYSASASAFASANTSFEDSAKVAIVDSNTAARIAARKTVDNILVKYTYVLSDLQITEMINTNLKTQVRPITGILLNEIANTVDDINYIVKKHVTITQDDYLLIPSGKFLKVPSQFNFINYGIIQIGDNRKVVPSAKVSKLSFTDPLCTSLGAIDIVVGGNDASNYNTINIGTDVTNNCAQLVITKDPTLSSTVTPTYNNSGTIYNNSGGTISVTQVYFRNKTGSPSGSVQNTDISAKYYSSAV